MNRKVLCVDDQEFVLRAFERNLRLHFEVESAVGPAAGLAAIAERGPYAAVLSDLRMPEMDGIEFLAAVKKQSPDTVRLIMSGNADLRAAIAAVNDGSIFRFLTKPIAMDTLRSAIDGALKQYQLIVAERDLLERTLGGTVRTFWELIQISSPLLAVRSNSVRDIALRITRETGLRDAWQYDLAATLCLVGCIALPDEVFQKAHGGETLPAEEEEMFHSHPERGASLISNIPRFEKVAEMIRNQHRPESAELFGEEISVGARMLHLALQLDGRIYRGLGTNVAIDDLRTSHRYDARMLDALEGYARLQPELDLRRLPIRNLRAGMILEDDFCSGENKILVFKAGTALTELWIERIRNFAGGRLENLITVRVPKWSRIC